jgi:hypothetical protein
MRYPLLRCGRTNGFLAAWQCLAAHMRAQQKCHAKVGAGGTAILAAKIEA